MLIHIGKRFSYWLGKQNAILCCIQWNSNWKAKNSGLEKICHVNGRKKESKDYDAVTREWNSGEKALKQDKGGQSIMLNPMKIWLPMH